MTIRKVNEKMIDPSLVQKVNDHTTQLAEKAKQTDLVAINAEVALKATKTELANVLDGTPKGTYATLAALQTAFPTGTTGVYIVTSDGHIYSWSGTAWTDRGLYQAVGIANDSITVEKANFIIKSVNKFNYNDSEVVRGSRLSNVGAVIVDAAFYTSHKIEVLPNETFIMRLAYAESGGFYTSNGTWISKIGTTSGSQLNFTFTAPSNASYMRVAGLVSNIETDMIVKGTSYPSAFIPFDRTLSNDINFNSKQNEKIIELAKQQTHSHMPTPKEIMSDLDNPFVRTNIKLLGDSITHGVGGTGFAQDGANIISTFYVNTSGYCWANLLKNYIEGKYNNRPFLISLRDNNIEKIGYNSFLADGGAVFKEVFYYPNLSTSEGKVKFSVQGAKFEVSVTTLSQGGILDVYSNDVKIGEIDTYSPTQVYGVVNIFDGLAVGAKTIELRTTGRKNASSTNTKVSINSINLFKVATVTNYGMAGIGFDWILRGTPNYLSQVIKDTDDIIIVQLGTNDRDTANNPKQLKQNADKVMKQLLGLNKKVIVMSSVPSSVENEQTKTFIHMEDVDNIIRHVAIDNGLQSISNYQHFLDYCDLKNIVMETVLPGGLHPNDAGYLIMYKNITKELGLGRKIEGATW